MLETRFSQNILDEANDLAIIVDSREELLGLSEGRINSAAQSAENKGLPGKFVIPLLNTSGQPVLTSLQNRELRERIHKASLSRETVVGNLIIELIYLRYLSLDQKKPDCLVLTIMLTMSSMIRQHLPSMR